MPAQEEHEKPENLVEQPGQAERSARTLGEAADSHHTLDGYAAINNVHDLPEAAQKEDDDPHAG